MRIGAFQLEEPVPELREPHALAMLRPWIDVGNVGTLTLNWLERQYGAREVARLSRPGTFFDFTRYRPVIYFSEGQRQVVVPNAYVTCARRQEGNDFLFLHLMEPHACSELYVDSVVRLLTTLGVQRYCLLGSMYDLVPHTRPLLISGAAVGESAEQQMATAGVEPSDYEGPTTIAFLVSQRMPELDIETSTMIVHLPQYTQLEEDYAGFARLMTALSSLYGTPVDQAAVAKSHLQNKEIDLALEKNPQLKSVVEQLEKRYDARTKAKKEGEMPRLSPEIENFLREMGKRFGQN